MDVALDDAGGDGVSGQASGVVNVELVHEALAMFLDGLDTDVELVGGFLVGFAFGDQLEHFGLSRAEPGDGLAGWVNAVLLLFLLMSKDAFGDVGAVELVSLGDVPDGNGQDMCGGLFNEKSGGSQGDRLGEIGVIPVSGKNEDLGGRIGLENLPGGFEPVEERHGNVHDDDCGVELGSHRDGFATVFGFLDDRNISFVLEQGMEAFSDHDMVIGQEHCNRGGRGHWIVGVRGVFADGSLTGW